MVIRRAGPSFLAHYLFTSITIQRTRDDERTKFIPFLFGPRHRRTLFSLNKRKNDRRKNELREDTNKPKTAFSRDANVNWSSSFDCNLSSLIFSSRRPAEAQREEEIAAPRARSDAERQKTTSQQRENVEAAK